MLTSDVDVVQVQLGWLQAPGAVNDTEDWHPGASLGLVGEKLLACAFKSFVMTVWTQLLISVGVGGAEKEACEKAP